MMGSFVAFPLLLCKVGILANHLVIEGQCVCNKSIVILITCICFLEIMQEFILTRDLK